jgi:hypothetical protein
MGNRGSYLFGRRIPRRRIPRIPRTLPFEYECVEQTTKVLNTCQRSLSAEIAKRENM